MYVFDTSLEAATTLHGSAHLQKLVFRLPSEVMKAAKRDQVRLLTSHDPKRGPSAPWNDDGLVTFSFSAEQGSSTPVFSDRRDQPLSRSAVQRIRVGSRVRLSIRQVRRRPPRPGSRLQVLKVQVLDLDAIPKGGPASPHSIQSVTLQLPLDLMQDVERLATQEDWSTQAWLRNAIESHARRSRQRLGLDESVA